MTEILEIEDRIEGRLYNRLSPDIREIRKDISDYFKKDEDRHALFERKIEALIKEEKEVDKMFNERLLKVEKRVSINFVIIILFIIFSVAFNFYALRKDHEAERRSIYHTEHILDSLIRRGWIY